MKGRIVDSIIIKVGHGIMTIPRDIGKIKRHNRPTLDGKKVFLGKSEQK